MASVIVHCRVCESETHRHRGTMAAPYLDGNPIQEKVFLCGKCYRKTPYSRAKCRLVINPADGKCSLEPLSPSEKQQLKSKARKNPPRAHRGSSHLKPTPLSQSLLTTDTIAQSGVAIVDIPSGVELCKVRESTPPAVFIDPSRPLDFVWVFNGTKWVPRDFGPCLFSHSWDPNAAIGIDGTVTSLREIKACEKVTLNYGYEALSRCNPGGSQVFAEPPRPYSPYSQLLAEEQIRFEYLARSLV